MALNIIKSTDHIPVGNVNVLIYGIPGVGKTSVGCSALNALLLDFDHGSHRSEFRSETLRPQSWSEVSGITAADLKPYNTIVLDTVGRALDMLTKKIMEDNPKFRKADGTLTLQGWGALKTMFTAWMSQMRLMGKDVIMLAHDKTKDMDEITVSRPDIQGGSHAEIFKLADSVAWFGPGGEKNHGILDFEPKPEHAGKNPGHIKAISVPNLHTNTHFLQDVLSDIKDALGQISERGRIVASEVEEWKNKIVAAKTMKAINEFVEEVQGVEDKAVQTQVKHIINDRAKDLGLGYHKEKKQYVKVKVDDDKGESDASE